jgi:hypothetical protein
MLSSRPVGAGQQVPGFPGNCHDDDGVGAAGPHVLHVSVDAEQEDADLLLEVDGEGIPLLAEQRLRQRLSRDAQMSSHVAEDGTRRADA